MTSMNEQFLFLAPSHVLELVLLPRLATPELLRLGLSCKGLLAWVTMAPLALWQVISSQHSPLDAQAHCCSGATLLKLAWLSTECCLELDNKHAFKPC